MLKKPTYMVRYCVDIDFISPKKVEILEDIGGIDNEKTQGIIRKDQREY